jgi:hypothetical protein
MSRIGLGRLLAVAALSLGVLATTPAGTLAAQPEVIHGSTRDTFEDDFILDLCGIRTLTTVTEHWTLTRYPDGSERFRTSRKFVPADPRLPIEYGAGMAFFEVDGTQTVTGSPIRLQRPGEGIVLLDAGLVIFSLDPTIRGPHPSLDVDLAEYYCA